jgi:hypothetical protein
MVGRIIESEKHVKKIGAVPIFPPNSSPHVFEGVKKRLNRIPKIMRFFAPLRMTFLFLSF